MRSPLIVQNIQDMSNMSSNMGSGEKHLGMTAPISLTPPDQADRDRTAALVKALEPHGCFEGEQELTHRMEVLATLNQLVKQWIKDLSIEKNMPPTLWKYRSIALKYTLSLAEFCSCLRSCYWASAFCLAFRCSSSF